MPVDDYPARLLAALRAAAPDGIDDPCVVVLTPGVYNAAYFEHALLARLMGVELVEGRDLICSGNRVRMLTTQGERPVHVVYRRVDDDFIDPLHFRPDSVHRLPRHRQRGPGRAGHPGQRDRQRRRRRQARLHLRAGPDPVLPERGTAHRQRGDLPARRRRRRRARRRARPPRRTGAQAGRRLGRQGHRDRPARLRGDPRRAAQGGARPIRAAGSRSGRSRCRRRRRCSATGSRPATSTCGRSRSTTATRCGCCPAA